MSTQITITMSSIASRYTNAQPPVRTFSLEDLEQIIQDLQDLLDHKTKLEINGICAHLSRRYFDGEISANATKEDRMIAESKRTAIYDLVDTVIMAKFPEFYTLFSRGQKLTQHRVALAKIIIGVCLDIIEAMKQGVTTYQI